MTYETERFVATEALVKACRLCRAVRSTLVSEETVRKKDRSPVTVADFGAQAVISRILEDLRKQGDIDLDAAQSFTMESTNYFDDRSRSEFLEQCVEGSMIPDVTIFNTAWLIERDLSEYYGKMAEQTEGKASQALKMLSSWEREHEKFFKHFRDKLTEVYSQMPWGG